MSEGLRTQRILTQIAPVSWEHPADRAALQALRRIPAFDEVLRKLFGLFGERPIRLAFQANAVRVNARQFPELDRLYTKVLQTMDAPTRWDLFVTLSPDVNAGAYGMDKPFIVMNSATMRLLNEDEQTFILGHEVGHILSGHVLYRTMIVLLIVLAQQGFPIVGLAARAVLVGLLEWSRKAELSCDRAGLLAGQNPEAALTSFMKLAGGGDASETNLNEFLHQADEYRLTGDVADTVFKVINLIGATHPFHVLRAAELRGWIEQGAYDRILRGEYTQRGAEGSSYRDDVAAAASSYRESMKATMGQMSDAAKRMTDAFTEGFRKPK